MSETWRVSRLDVEVRYEDGVPIIEARGECDLITSRRLREVAESLINTAQCRIVFDLRDMTYIDSSGFRVLLEAKTKVAEKGGNIALVSLTAPVERVFNLLRLGELIIRTDTIQEAVEQLKGIECH